jgi:hypothetical protein
MGHICFRFRGIIIQLRGTNLIKVIAELITCISIGCRIRVDRLLLTKLHDACGASVWSNDCHLVYGFDWFVLVSLNQSVNIY